MFANPNNSFRKRLVHLVSLWRARKLLARAKYVHLIHNDKFAKPFVDFLNRNFPPEEHLVLCKRMLNFPFPEGPNVLEVRKFTSGFDLDRENIDKIISHSLFAGQVDYFYRHLDLQRRKAYWIMWGGDLYDARRDEKNDSVRRNFRGYVNYIDREYALRKYGMSDNFFDLQPYALGVVPWNLLQSPCEPHAKPRIQVNNSCDESTLVVLEDLKMHAGKIVVTTVLSYGDMRWREKILACGRELFGEDFEPVLEYMTAEDYAKYMQSNDVLILNQKRQQGMTNVAAQLALGHKIFVRSDVSTYRYLRNHGFELGDACRLREMSCEEILSCPPEQRHKQVASAKKFFFDEHFISEQFCRFFENGN